MDRLQRAVKIAVSATMAVYIAMMLDLKNPYSAGIIAILSVLDTVTDSIHTALSRIWSTVLAFSVAVVVFYLMGYSALAFGVYLLIYVPLAYTLKAAAGVAPCSVLVTHFILAESVSWQWILNGFLLMLIGTSCALLVNIWKPSLEKSIQEGKKAIEDQMRVCLHLMSKRLTDSDMKMETIQRELGRLSELLDETEEMAFQNYKDQIWSGDDWDIHYVQMRREQYNVLLQMAQALPHIKLNTDHNNLLAKLFTQTADEFAEDNTALELLESIQALYRIYRDSELPKSREEFESRAVLYRLLIDFERFLELKREYYLSFKQSKKA